MNVYKVTAYDFHWVDDGEGWREEKYVSKELCFLDKETAMECAVNWIDGENEVKITEV